MAKAIPYYAEIAPGTPDIEGLQADAAAILKETHGVHGLRFLGSAAADGEVRQSPALTIAESETGYALAFKDSEGISQLVEGDLHSTLSEFAVKGLFTPTQSQTSREDHALLRDYEGRRPQLGTDPTTWLMRNPFLFELARRHPQYGNLMRHLVNERGMFLKVGNYPSERAYWNSTTNGGLPVVKKADPDHEGTFTLHDMIHFVPIDPVLGDRQPNETEQATYMAHRLLSEASTLVLADMVAVADGQLEERGYDVNKRRIYPVYTSIKEAQGEAPDANKLLAANAYFCFTGDTKGFELLGASDESLDGYRQKYETVFRDDFMWNLQNLQNMMQEANDNPHIADYQAWLQHEGGFPSLANYDPGVVTSHGVDVAGMLSNFRANFKNAFNYQESIDDLKHHKKASHKYWAGQRIVFARYADLVPSAGHVEEFDAVYQSAQEAESKTKAHEVDSQLGEVVDSYLSKVDDGGHILPHALSADRFAAPLYPVKFVNYERKRAGSGRTLSDEISAFTQANSTGLRRLIDIVEA